MAFTNRWVWVLGMMLGLVALTQGCKSSPEMAERNVVVSLDDSVGRTAVEVNLIGANDADFERVGKEAVDNYWREVAAGRPPKDRYVMKFTGGERSKTLSASDAIWQTWRGKNAMQLVAIAFIPGLSGSGEGARDPRRLVISLDKRRWSKLVDIHINASQSGLTSSTVPDKEP